MSRDNLKLVSIRMDDELIQKLDQLSHDYTYWNRSDIIRNILTAVLAEMSKGDIYNMVRYYYNKRNVVNAKFEITDELKPYEKK